MSRTDRLPLLAMLLATFLAGGLAIATDDSPSEDGEVVAASAGDVVTSPAVDAAEAVSTSVATGLALVEPGAVARLAAAVTATTTTTTTTTTTAPPQTTTTTTPPPRPTTTVARTAPAPTPAPAPAPAPAPPPPPAPTTDASCAANFASWMNSFRGSNGVGPLTTDGGIAYIPTNWSKSMASNQNLAHNPNYIGQIRSARPESRAWGENVGYSSAGARSVFDNMVASSGHRATMLNSGYTRAATGCAVDVQGRVWVTVDFWG